MAVSIFPPRCQRQRAWQKRSKQKINSKPNPNSSPNLTPTLKITLTPTLTLTVTLTQTLTLNLTPKRKLWKVLKKVEKRKGKSPRWESNWKAMAYQMWSITATLCAELRLHDKLTFLFELRHATRQMFDWRHNSSSRSVATRNLAVKYTLPN